MKRTLLILLCMTFLKLSATTVTAVNSGSWFSPATWSGNSVPSISDEVLIPSGFHITVDLPTASVESTPWDNAGSIKVYGTLELQGTDPLFKTPVAIEVFSGGILNDNTDFSETIFTAPSSIKVNNGGIFTSAFGYPNIRVVSNNTIHYMFEGTDFPGPFTLTIDGSAITFTPVALPVHLKTFTGTLLKNAIRLDWASANEINFREYDVERSIDGDKFERLATISAKGGSENVYSYTDTHPLPGDNIYRLVLQDQNGKAQYGSIVTVNFQQIHPLKLYPVPAKGRLTIETQEKGQLFVYAASGQLVLQTPLVAGNNTVDTHSLSTGLYYAEFNQQKITFTIIK